MLEDFSSTKLRFILIKSYTLQLATKGRARLSEKTVRICNHRIDYGDLKDLASLDLPPPRKDTTVLEFLLNGILPK